MRKLWLVLALVAWPAMAAATGPEPAMRTGTFRFELFGTSFCYGGMRACDVTLAPEVQPAATVEAETDDPRKLELLGLTLCVSRDECDVSWVPPEAAQPWRDQPEMRILAALR